MPPAPRFPHSGLDSRLFDEPNLSETFRVTFFEDWPPDDPFTLLTREFSSHHPRRDDIGFFRYV